ncbi:MAG: hypothetical protein JSW43_09955 [Gemmatimonadota bacterium]|nr:MAG: hypothetical protein JSW43_09955 [Gemmatimonadota bacterium]
MARELGGSQISALLEAVPGIRSVLRSPVADALVHMIRAGAGLEDFRLDQAQELVQYSVRRGLISADEGDELMLEVSATARGKRAGKRRQAAPARKRPAGKATKKAAPARKRPAGKATKKAPKKSAAKKQPAGKKPNKRVKKR